MHNLSEITYYRDTKQILVTRELEPDDYTVVVYPTPESDEVLFWGSISLFISGNPNVIHAHATDGKACIDVSQVLLHGSTDIDPDACLLHDAQTHTDFGKRGLSRLLRSVLMHTGAKLFKKNKMICYIDEDNDRSIKSRFFLSKIAPPNHLSNELLHTSIDIKKSKISVLRDIRVLFVETDMTVPATYEEQKTILSQYI